MRAFVNFHPAKISQEYVPIYTRSFAGTISWRRTTIYSRDTPWNKPSTCQNCCTSTQHPQWFIIMMIKLKMMDKVSSAQSMTAKRKSIITCQRFWLAQTIDPARVPYLQFIQDHNMSTEERVKALYITNKMFTRWSTKVYCLVLYTNGKQKYIPIDTIILYDLLGQTSSTEMSIDQFRERQVQIWQTNFKSFFHIQRTYRDEEAIIVFQHTDGVGASITTGRWRWVVRREETPAQNSPNSSSMAGRTWPMLHQNTNPLWDWGFRMDWCGFR